MLIYFPMAVEIVRRRTWFAKPATTKFQRGSGAIPSGETIFKVDVFTRGKGNTVVRKRLVATDTGTGWSKDPSMPVVVYRGRGIKIRPEMSLLDRIKGRKIEICSG